MGCIWSNQWGMLELAASASLGRTLAGRGRQFFPLLEADFPIIVRGRMDQCSGRGWFSVPKLVEDGLAKKNLFTTPLSPVYFFFILLQLGEHLLFLIFFYFFKLQMASFYSRFFDSDIVYSALHLGEAIITIGGSSSWYDWARLSYYLRLRKYEPIS